MHLMPGLGSFFTDEETAILTITEEMILISHDHVSDETYEQATNLLGETYLGQVILAVITINAWNRIGITTKLIPA
jgi:alkylhydroperoxidase family enzyme